MGCCQGEGCPELKLLRLARLAQLLGPKRLALLHLRLERPEQLLQVQPVLRPQVRLEQLAQEQKVRMVKAERLGQETLPRQVPLLVLRQVPEPRPLGQPLGPLP